MFPDNVQLRDQEQTMLRKINHGSFACIYKKKKTFTLKQSEVAPFL